MNFPLARQIDPPKRGVFGWLRALMRRVADYRTARRLMREAREREAARQLEESNQKLFRIMTMMIEARREALTVGEEDVPEIADFLDPLFGFVQKTRGGHRTDGTNET